MKPAKLILPGGNAVKTQMPSELEIMSTNVEQACDHDYTMEASLVNQAKRKDAGSAPPTPNKPPSGKKRGLQPHHTRSHSRYGKKL